MINHHYNNIGVSSLAIAAIMNHAIELPTSKALLILPFVTHRNLLSYLSRQNSNVKSIEKLIVDKLVCFTNFNNRFYDHLLLSLNTIQFLSEIDVVSFSNSSLKLKTALNYERTMGQRVKTIYMAAANIAALLSDNAENLYLNLRIEL